MDRVNRLEALNAMKAPWKKVGTRPRLFRLFSEFAKQVEACCDHDHLSPDDLLGSVVAAFERRRELFRCPRRDVLAAILEAASLGWDCTSQAHLIPCLEGRRRRLVLRPGYRGLANCARRDPAIATLDAAVVHDGERFSVRLGAGVDRHVEHERILSETASLRTIAAYAYAELVGAQPVIEVVDRETAARAREGSPRPDLWDTETEQMWQGLALRRLAKRLDSPALNRAFALYDASFRFTEIDSAEVGVPVAAVLADRSTRMATAA